MQEFFILLQAVVQVASSAEPVPMNIGITHLYVRNISEHY